MNILGINGTPHKRIGVTTSIMDELFKGVKDLESSAECEMVFLADREINYCKGCGSCMIKGKCPQEDDMPDLIEKIIAVDGIVLGSPVYVLHVTAQMKTFIDRMVAFGHRPRLQGKYGAAVSVSAGWGDQEVALYLNGVIGVLGAQSVGITHGIAVGPGMFQDKDILFAHARRLGTELASAIKEKRQYPANSFALNFQRFLGDLIFENRKFFKEDYRYRKEMGMYKERILD